MKKFLSSLVFLFPLLLIAQTDQVSGTTLDEYRYMAKGYGYQLSMGLDAFKEGYEIKSIAKSKNKVQYIGLYKNGASQPQAVLLVINAGAIEPTYICLPNNMAQERVWDLYAMDRKAINDPQIWELYDAAMRDFAFQMMGNAPAEMTFDSPEDYEELAQSQSDDSAESEAGDEAQEQEKTGETSDQSTWTAKGSKAGAAAKKQAASRRHEAINTDVVITLDEDLTDIGVVKAPVIRGSYPSKGILVIKFCVNSEGEVQNARYTMRGSTTYQEKLKELALESIQNSTFAPSDEDEQCGTATFHFK